MAVDRNDALLERVRRDIPDVIAVANTHHAGAGGARNSGVAASSGDVCAPSMTTCKPVSSGWPSSSPADPAREQTHRELMSRTAVFLERLGLGSAVAVAR